MCIYAGQPSRDMIVINVLLTAALGNTVLNTLPHGCAVQVCIGRYCPCQSITHKYTPPPKFILLADTAVLFSKCLGLDRDDETSTEYKREKREIILWNSLRMNECCGVSYE